MLLTQDQFITPFSNIKFLTTRIKVILLNEKSCADIRIRFAFDHFKDIFFYNRILLYYIIIYSQVVPW